MLFATSKRVLHVHRQDSNGFFVAQYRVNFMEFAAKRQMGPFHMLKSHVIFRGYVSTNYKRLACSLGRWACFNGALPDDWPKLGGQ
jgi:hypothetical protein